MLRNGSVSERVSPGSTKATRARTSLWSLEKLLLYVLFPYLSPFRSHHVSRGGVWLTLLSWRSLEQMTGWFRLGGDWADEPDLTKYRLYDPPILRPLDPLDFTNSGDENSDAESVQGFEREASVDENLHEDMYDSDDGGGEGAQRFDSEGARSLQEGDFVRCLFLPLDVVALDDVLTRWCTQRMKLCDWLMEELILSWTRTTIW